MENNWVNFCEEAATVMRDALDNKISLEDATNFFDNDKTVTNKDLRRYLTYIIWEIDGSRDYYLQVMNLFEKKASEEEFVQRLELS